MKSSDTYFQFSKIYLSNLKKSLPGIGQGQLRNLVSLAEKALQDPQSHNILEVVSEPFIYCMNNGLHKYDGICLDYFASVFANSTLSFFPSKDLAAEILNASLVFTPTTDDTMKIKICSIINNLMRSPVGSILIHTDRISRTVQFLIKMYDRSLNTSSAEVAQMTLNECIRGLIDSFQRPATIPVFDDPKDLINYVVKTCEENVITIIGYPGCRSIQEADIFCLITEVCHRIQDPNLKDPTIALCLQILNGILVTNFPFYDTDAFYQLMRSEIHYAIVSAAFGTHKETSVSTSNLLVTMWKRFSQHYMVGFGEVFIKSVIPSLMSPTCTVVQRGLAIVRKVSENPQALVDLFVNFDCDEKGSQPNIFQTIVEAVINRSYFDADPDDLVPRYGIKTIVAVLKGLWEFYESHPNDESQGIIEAIGKKDLLESGFDIFKQSPMKGIAFFQQKKMCGESPSEIADFLFNNPGLNPAAVGEILGGHKDPCPAILKEFVRHFDFTNKSFASCFREFLSSFQIPGEAQMIDRVMEQFGLKYYADNPTAFRIADTAYVLSFSTLMLHTDAHHPSVTKRMTLEQFIANNSGIDQNHDLPKEFLTDLYYDITGKEINLIKAPTITLKREQRAEQYRESCQKTLSLLKEEGGLTESRFTRCESNKVIGPMFEKVWCGILAVLTLAFEKSDDSSIIDNCLSGLSYAAHIASHCYVETALDTLIDSFTKFTRLRTYARGHISEKNLKCTDSLLDVTRNDMTSLKGVWPIVLGEISALERLSKRSDLEFIFNRCNELGAEEILEFVSAMCSVAEDEVKEHRFFTLTHFGNVMLLNKERPRVHILQIWKKMAQLITRLALSPDETVAANALAVIKPVASVFVDRSESSGFHFEADLIAPLDDIIQRSPSKYMRELGFDTAVEIVKKIGKDLHSGWQVILEIVANLSTDDESRTKGIAFFNQIIAGYIQSVKEFMFQVTTTAAALKITNRKTLDMIANECNTDDEWLSMIVVIKAGGNDWITVLGEIFGENEERIGSKVWKHVFQVETKAMKLDEKRTVLTDIVGRFGEKEGALEFVKEQAETDDEELRLISMCTLERFNQNSTN